MSRLTVLCVALTLAVATSVAAEKRALTIADLYRIKSVADPHFSPDGKLIAFQVTEYNLEKGKSDSDVYLMNADGSGLRKMTEGPSADYHPRWADDGGSLLFLSTRENGAQAWRLPVDGGEATQVTDFSMGVDAPVAIDGGKRIVFVSEVFAECGADDACNKKLGEDMEDGPLQAHVADDLMYRHWTFWKDGKRFHTLVYDVDADSVTDLTPGEVDAPYYETGGGDAGWSVSPDGTELCVGTNRDANHWETTNKDLFLVPLAGGEMVNITDDNEAYDGQPDYSPDGRYIAYLMQRVPRYESDRFRLALYDRKSGEKTVLTEDFDNWVHGFRWAPDSKSIYFTAEVEGRNPLYRLDLKSRKITKIMTLHTIDSFDVSPDGKNVVVASRAIDAPLEIWSATTGGKNVRRLTTFNRPVEDEVDIRPVEEAWVDSPSGKKIQTWIVKPHGFDPARKYPLVLNVHGGPQGMWWDSWRGDWQVYPGAGYVLAFPNPHGSTGFGQEFTHEISRDWAGKVYEDIMAVADYMTAQPYVDADRMGAMGWSYGGYMMMWMEGHTDRFKALACMMGVYDLPAMWGATEELWFPQYDLGGAPWESEDYARLSPHYYVQSYKTPCLVITGERDYRVPYTQSLEFFTGLQKMDVPSRLIVFKNDGHWPNWVKSMPLYYNAHLDWFHRYLGGDPAPYDVKKMVQNRALKAE